MSDLTTLRPTNMVSVRDVFGIDTDLKVPAFAERDEHVPDIDATYRFNPAVTLVFALRRELPARDAILFILVQIAAGMLGAWAVHLMFDLPIMQFSTKARAGIGQWSGEFVATFGLVLVILTLLKHRAEAIPTAVALYITSAYWFTSSTSFANPAITVVRSLSNTFAGIAPADVPLFIAAQLAGAVSAAVLARWLLAEPEAR